MRTFTAKDYEEIPELFLIGLPDEALQRHGEDADPFEAFVRWPLCTRSHYSFHTGVFNDVYHGTYSRRGSVSL